jgi:radical SAM-linked protein
VDARTLATEARQRWRIVFRRGPEAARETQRELVDGWEAAIVAAGIPLVAAGKRPRLAFAAPLPIGVAAEHELADLLLAEARPVYEVRERLARTLPAGYALVDLYDVWVGEPSLAAAVAAADYRITLVPEERSTAGDLATAASALLAARTLPRERAKGGGTVGYDLRPLLSDVCVADPGPPVVLRARTRFDRVLGTGRPEEVVAALGDMLGRPLVPAAIVRERVVVEEELGKRSGGGGV